jgi:hypothetical protein
VSERIFHLAIAVAPEQASTSTVIFAPAATAWATIAYARWSTQPVGSKFWPLALTATKAESMTTAHHLADSILVFVPIGKETAARNAPLAHNRRASGPSLVVGMLDNHKHNSDKVFDRLQQLLGEKMPTARFVRVKKPEAGKGAPKALLDDLASRCQAVVTGIAD